MARRRCRSAPSSRRGKHSPRRPATASSITHWITTKTRPTASISTLVRTTLAIGDTAYMKTTARDPACWPRGGVRSGRHPASAGRHHARLQRLSVEFGLRRRQQRRKYVFSTTARWGRISCAASSWRASGRAISPSARPESRYRAAPPTEKPALNSNIQVLLRPIKFRVSAAQSSPMPDRSGGIVAKLNLLQRGRSTAPLTAPAVPSSATAAKVDNEKFAYSSWVGAWLRSGI